MLLVQVLVLGFTGVLWWIARRDLALRVPPPAPSTADTAELEQLCATLETLVTSLARRLEALEQRPMPEQKLALPGHSAAGQPFADAVTPVSAAVTPASAASTPELRPVPDPRFVPVYALLEAGISDPLEIARQTGLERGEIDLILSLRDRRAF